MITVKIILWHAFREPRWGDKQHYKLLSYLFEGLQQVAPRNRQGDVYVVHDEERLLLALVWETGEVVCYKQQHVYFRLLQKQRKEEKRTMEGQCLVQTCVAVLEFANSNHSCKKKKNCVLYFKTVNNAVWHMSSSTTHFTKKGLLFNCRVT